MDEMDGRRIEELKALRRTRIAQEHIHLLTKDVLKARRACFIYFHLIQFGWGPATYLRGRLSHVRRQIPVSSERRLGYPGRGVCWRAMGWVHQVCPEESALYERTMLQFLDARRIFRLSAGQTIALVKRRAAINGVPSLWRQYQNAAARKARRSLKTLARCRLAIFDKMGVPKEFQTLA